MPDDEVPQWLSGERRHPTVEAMLGAIGGLVALGGATALYGEVPDDEARAAGVVLAAGAVLPLAFLLANDPETIDPEGDVLVGALLAVALWLLLYAVGPARGHGIFLGLALFGLWLGVLSQTTPESLVGSPFRAVEREEVEFGPIPAGPGDRGGEFSPFEPAPPPTFGTPPGQSPRTVPRPPPPRFRFPSTTTSTTAVEQSLGEARLVSTQFADIEHEPPVAPAVVSMLFGLAYLAAAFALDGARLRRAASAFLVAGITAALLGAVFSAPRLGGTWASLLGLAFSLGIVAIGVVAGRRFVAWLGAGAAAIAATATIGSLFDDSGSAAALAMLVVGAAVVGLGVVAGREDAPA